MRYLLLVVLLSGCSVNKDIHDMGDRVSVLSHDVEQNTEELKKLGHQTDPAIGEITKEYTDNSHASPTLADNIPQFDISQKSEKELTAIAVKAENIASAPISEEDKKEPFTVANPPTNIAPAKQALIYRIKAYLAQIFKKKTA